MKNHFSVSRAQAAGAFSLCLLLAAASARADITGFGGSGTGWTINGSATVSADVATVTTDSILEAGSVFFNAPQNINAFSLTFTYTTSNLGGGQTADGMTFTLQNQGPTALGGNGGYLGYSGISPAAGVAFNLLSNGSITPGTGYAPTSVPYNYQSVSPVNMYDPLNVTLTYDGTTLREFLTDTLTSATFSTSYVVNLASAVGGNTAYVGFTGGTGLGAANQAISGFSYTAVPEPATLLAAPFVLLLLASSKRTH